MFSQFSGKPTHTRGTCQRFPSTADRLNGYSTCRHLIKILIRDKRYLVFIRTLIPSYHQFHARPIFHLLTLSNRRLPVLEKCPKRPNSPVLSPLAKSGCKYTFSFWTQIKLIQQLNLQDIEFN